MLHTHAEAPYGISTYLVIGLGGLHANEVPNFLPENTDILYRPLVKLLIVLNSEAMFLVDLLDEVPHRGRGGVGMPPNLLGGNGIRSHCVRQLGLEVMRFVHTKFQSWPLFSPNMRETVGEIRLYLFVQSEGPCAQDRGHINPVGAALPVQADSAIPPCG